MLISPQLDPVRVRVANFPLSATHELGQVAGPKRLILDFLDNGYVDVQLLIESERHELAADGSLGEPAGSGYTKAPEVLLIANGNCAVDSDDIPRYRLINPPQPATAQQPAVLGTALNLATNQVETFAAGQDWLGYLGAKPESLWLQNAAFGRDCAENTSQTIFDKLRRYIRLANVRPSRFTDGN